jgi:LacI family transcriptional regulator
MTTIKEIAEKAGVSIGTVDRVIHKRGRVSPETEGRIQSIIDDLDYRPNLFARVLKLSRTYTFGIFMPDEDQDGGYWALSASGIRRALIELEGNRIQGRFFTYDRYSSDSFERTATILLDACPDGLLIAPILTKYIPELIHQSLPEMPYAFFDSDIPGLHPISVINQDAYRSGRLAAELITKIARPPAVLLVLRFMPDDYHISARCRGFRDFFSGLEGYAVQEMGIDVSNDSPSLTAFISRFREEHPNLKGIFSTNALTYRAALALEELYGSSRPALVGYDLIQDNAKWLERGVIDFIISQQPEMQGYRGIYSLYRHVILKEKVDRQVMMPLDIITRESIHHGGF